MRHDKAARILHGLFYKMFGNPATNPMGWGTAKLGDIIAETRNGLYKPAEFFGHGISILKMFNIQNGELDLNRLDLVEVTDEEYETYCLLPGDILLNRVNTPDLVGKCALITKFLQCHFAKKAGAVVVPTCDSGGNLLVAVYAVKLLRSVLQTSS